MSKEESEEENKNIKKGLTIAKVGSGIIGSILTIGVFAIKIVTGDILGAASIIKSTIPIIGKAAGLTPIVKKAGEYIKEKFGDSKVLDALGKVWQVLTSRPAKLIYNGIGIGLAIAASAFPPIIALSVGAMAFSTAIGARNIGRTKRLEQETKAAEEALYGIVKTAKDKNLELDKFLAAKLTNNKAQGVDGAKIGVAVARGSILESSALILEVVSDATNIVGVVIASMAVFGTLTGEANEAIENQQKRNTLLAQREGVRAKVVCAVLAHEPDIDKLDQKALDERYNEVYKANFSKSFGDKFKNIFKDIGSGIGGHLFGGISKIFSKAPEVSTVALPINSANQLLNKAQAQKQTPPSASHSIETHGVDIIHAAQNNAHIDKAEHAPHVNETAASPELVHTKGKGESRGVG